ncbi:hypothetical protein BGX27_001891 [Mortierella sp. AM989]|nr:hypothetical protein BGX27_001891 [Mortierella sp. AM989]
MEVMKPSFSWDFMTVVFVGPLSENDFLELLKNVTSLDIANIEEIVKITNRVARELMKPNAFVNENLGLPLEEDFRKFENDRTEYFAGVAAEYYKEIKEDYESRERFYEGLAQAFLYDSVREFQVGFLGSRTSVSYK